MLYHGAFTVFCVQRVLFRCQPRRDPIFSITGAQHISRLREPSLVIAPEVFELPESTKDILAEVWVTLHLLGHLRRTGWWTVGKDGLRAATIVNTKFFVGDLLLSVCFDRRSCNCVDTAQLERDFVVSPDHNALSEVGAAIGSAGRELRRRHGACVLQLRTSLV